MKPIPKPKPPWAAIVALALLCVVAGVACAGSAELKQWQEGAEKHRAAQTAQVAAEITIDWNDPKSIRDGMERFGFLDLCKMHGPNSEVAAVMRARNNKEIFLCTNPVGGDAAHFCAVVGRHLRQEWRLKAENGSIVICERVDGEGV